MDNLTHAQRHKNMKAIKSKDTVPELLLRKALWHKGIRYRKNYTALPGKPDIAITKFKIAIFCDGSFFHGYDWDNKKHNIKSNQDYWIPKIEKNIIHDKNVNAQLTELGWTVIRFWDFEIKKDVDTCVNLVLKCIRITVDDLFVDYQI